MAEPILKVRIDGKEFAREFDSWDSLIAAKDALKEASGWKLRWHWSERTWILDGYVPNPERFASVVAEVFGVGKEEVLAFLREHNAKYEYAQAELYEEKWENGNGGKGRARNWVVISFASKNIMWEVYDEIRERYGKSVSYRYVVFEAGEPQLRKREIRVAGVDGMKLVLAPFLYARAKADGLFKGLRLEERFVIDHGEIDVVDVAERLRPYQKDALQKWIENGMRGAIQIPTGGGKTWIGLAAIGKVRRKTLIVVPTITLAEQWREKIIEVLGFPEEGIGILGGGKKEIGKDILIATYDSAAQHITQLAKIYGFFIFDEAHHVAADYFKVIGWNMLAPHVLALSATLERDDGNEEFIYAICDGKVYEISYYDLVKAGWLAPVDVRIEEIGFSPEEEKKYREMEEELEKLKEKMRELYRERADEAYLAGYPSVGDYLRKIKDPEYKELNAKIMSLRARMRVLEQKNSSKVARAIEIAEEELARGARIFIFTNLENQAKKIWEELAEKHGEKAALVTGKTKNGERTEIFRSFREGRIRVIVTTTVLDEGVDAPAADVAIIVSSRAIKHPRQFVQRIGRIVRPQPGKISRIWILRTAAGGAEEKTLGALKGALEEVYKLSEMKEIIRELEEKKQKKCFEYEVVLSLEKAQRRGGHKARTLIANKELASFIGAEAEYEIEYGGEKIKEGRTRIKEKRVKGKYIYGAIRISASIECAGKKVKVRVCIVTNAKTDDSK